MTSNRDWLMRLAHEAPDELAAWMGAEHGEPPEGDAVKLLREAAGSDVSNLLLINSTSACDVEEAYGKLADMVERDYVPREAYEDLRDEFTWETTFLHRMGKQCGTKDVPSLVAYVDKLEARVEELEAVDRRIAETDSRWEAATRDLERMTAERDEWKTKLDAETKARNACARHAANMEAERDEWKAKAEGSSKVRAGSSSAKRAAAVERLKDVRYHTLADYVRAMLGWGHEPHFEDCRDALIDLLTDGSCGQDADQGKRTEAPVRENLHDSSNEAQKPRSREADSGNVSDSDVENLHVEQDSREKLEADVREFVMRTLKCGDLTYGVIMKMLNRQAAISEREAREQLDADWPKLLRCLESDYNIKASWDGLRGIWLTERADGSAVDAVRKFAERYETRIEELERLWHAFENEVAAQSVEIAERDKRIVELESELSAKDGYIARKLGLQGLDHYQQRIAELEAERDKWKAEAEKEKADAEIYGRSANNWEEKCHELQEQVDKLTVERDGWRMRCGKLLDAAHEMQRIADVWEVE